ncbi:hypothetical protein LJC04_04610 [Ruminococcaceae bacterium OttesenSCG-928-O06]|nr:hypothetical protein [Ruminococcaceae bacterium OttesenSCG-928-O06]
MPTSAQSGLLAAAESVTSAWRMSFSSVHFLLFLPLVVAGFFLLPQKWRRAWLLLGSYYFYFFAAPKYLVVLLCGTLATWLLGLFIGRAAAGKPRRARMAFGVVLLVLGLCFFKYNGFFAAFLSPLFAAAGANYPGGYFTTAGALGISFYTFTAIGYLVDTARGDVPAEKNLLNFALFLGFFPSVTMGPISRAGGLLPQLQNPPAKFDAAGAADALRLAAAGYFKKLAVADTLAIFTTAVYGNITAYTGGTLTLAAAAFAVQLYFDFSGYTDIARATAQLLGIQLPQNFKNPYYATNFSAFWQRWHISLSSWLQDYVFTPLVWSRWTEKLPIIGKKVAKPPVLTSLAITFVLSGVWHGDGLCFLVWGTLQAAFRIGEEVLHRTLGKPKKNAGRAARAGKTAVVLVLWAESLVFFKMGMTPLPAGAGQGWAVKQAALALVRQFSPAGFARIGADISSAVQNGFYNDGLIAGAFILFCLVCTALALWADWAEHHRFGGQPFALQLGAFTPGARWGIYILLVVCCFAAFLAQSGGYGGASFLYGGF